MGKGQTVGEQTTNTLANVDAALKQAGSSKEYILATTVWLKDIERDYDAMNVAYDEWVRTGPPPARVCVESKLAFEHLLVEIQVTAVKAPLKSEL